VPLAYALGLGLVVVNAIRLTNVPSTTCCSHSTVAETVHQ
jgi:hypothetical protein